MSTCGYDRVTTLLLDGGHPGPIRRRPHQKLESWTASNRHPVFKRSLSASGDRLVPVCKPAFSASRFQSCFRTRETDYSSNRRTPKQRSQRVSALMSAIIGLTRWPLSLPTDAKPTMILSSTWLEPTGRTHSYATLGLRSRSTGVSLAASGAPHYRSMQTAVYGLL